MTRGGEASDQDKERGVYGRGTVYQKADGRWTAQLRLPRGVRKTYYGRSEREVRAKLGRARKAFEAGQLAAAPSVSVHDYLSAWLEQVVAPSVRPKTLESARLNVKRVSRLVGRVRLGALSAPVIQDLYGSLLEAGLSPRSVAQVHETLYRAMRQAVQWDLLPKNPVDAARAPRPRHREMRTLSESELRRLFDVTADERLHALWVLLASTGLRIGEALGLQWTDVDFGVGRLEVRRALQWQHGRGLVFVEPKTLRSRRGIYLAPGVVEALNRHRALQEEERRFAGSEWRDAGLVFCRAEGDPLAYMTVWGAFRRALLRAGLPRIRIHDLRHTAATLLLKDGVHPKVVQELLGHSSITLTLDIYSHVVPSLHMEVAKRMQTILGLQDGSKLAASTLTVVDDEGGVHQRRESGLNPIQGE